MCFSGAAEDGFTAIESLTVVLLMAVLIVVALPRYFEARDDSLKTADLATLRAINTTIALFQARHRGACPGQPGRVTFASFVHDRLYFPDGPPHDPRTNTLTPYLTSYVASVCYVFRSATAWTTRQGRATSPRWSNGGGERAETVRRRRKNEPDS